MFSFNETRYVILRNVVWSTGARLEGTQLRDDDGNGEADAGIGSESIARVTSQAHRSILRPHHRPLHLHPLHRDGVLRRR